MAFVAPSKLIVRKESLRKDISKLQKEALKANDTIGKLHARLKENSSKKSKVHGGDAKTAEVWAEEKAKEMHHRWRTDDEAMYTEQIRTSKESHVVLTEKNGKLKEALAAEKTVCREHKMD